MNEVNGDNMTTEAGAAVFLDRDDTLLQDPGYQRDPEQVRLLPGVAGAVAELRSAGYPVIVVTNQSGVARGYLTEDDVEAVHQRMQDLLRESGSGVDAIYYCPYLDGSEAVVEEYRRDSDLRKPGSGMLRLAAEEMGIDLEASWMVGDSGRDIRAGQAVGCRTILIGNGELDFEARPDFVAADLSSAVELILANDAADAPSQDAPVLTAASLSDGHVEANLAEEASELNASEMLHSDDSGRGPHDENPDLDMHGDPPADAVREEEVKAVEAEAEGPESQPMEPPPSVVSDSSGDAELREIRTVLGEILEELKAERRSQKYADFSIAQLAGAVAQAVALCVIGWGLYAAIDGKQPGSATIWLLAGIALQIMALTGFAVSGRK